MIDTTNVRIPVNGASRSDDRNSVREVIVVDGVSKSFGATQALRECSVTFAQGEIHAILGENGCGKSTLIKVLSGAQVADSGEVRINGVGVRLRSPAQAHSHGVHPVFQEVLVVAAQSVENNIWLGVDGLFRKGMTRAKRRTTAAKVMRELLGREINLDARVESLPLSERQACCLARAIVRKPRVLILDEATSALDLDTRNRLFAMLRRLQSQGTTILFISHRMDEIEEIADRVTVMRSGSVVRTVLRGEADSDELVRMMTGSKHSVIGLARATVNETTTRPVVLEARDVRLRGDGAPIDFALRQGEIVGLAGLEHQGQEHFLHMLAGHQRPASGHMSVVGEDGMSRRVRSLRSANQLGIALIARDRSTESLFGVLSIQENFSAATMQQDRRLGLLSAKRAKVRLERYVEDMAIKAGPPSNAITTLSGGNQQKVVLARWLAASPRVLLLNDSTRGVDLGAKREIYALLRRLADTGLAVVMNSTEVDEHLELMDRTLVFREGKVQAELHRPDLTRSALVGAYFGQEVD